MNGDGNEDEEKKVKAEEVDGVVERPRTTTFLVMGCVKVACESNGRITVEWEGNALNDGIADAVMAVLYSVETSPASVIRTLDHAMIRTWNLRGELLTASTDSSKQHSHSHDHTPKNPHADITPDERLSRLCMFLEAQFGPAVTPIQKPKIASKHLDDRKEANGVKAEPTDDNDADELAELEAEELERLHDLGIPVPGLEIRMDKYVAKVWLETLEVECASQVFAQRVRAVVERAAETVAPLWSRQQV